jgi:hypothetical protein
MKKRVDLISLRSADEIELVARCILTPDGVQIEGEDRLAERLKGGVYSPLLGRRVVPAEGEPFLEALRFEFKSLHLTATEVQSGEELRAPELVKRGVGEGK